MADRHDNATPVPRRAGADWPGLDAHHVLALTLLRLLWVALRPSKPGFEMAAWMHALSRLVHGALWALMLAWCTKR